MRKVMFALFLLLAVIVLGIWEIAYSSQKYDEMNANLTSLSQIVQNNKADTGVYEVQNEIQSIKTKWEKHKKFFTIVTNHNITKLIDQQLSCIETTSKENAFEDLCLYINTLKKLLDTQKKELYPTIDNLL